MKQILRNWLRNIFIAVQTFLKWTKLSDCIRLSLDFPVRHLVKDFLKRQHLHSLFIHVSLVLITFVCLHQGWKGWSLISLTITLSVRRLLMYRQKMTTARLLYRLALERVRQNRKQSDQIKLMALNQINISADLHLVQWLDTIVQHFWPLGLCFSFQDALNSKYIGPEVNFTKARQSLFGVRFEFFQLDSDFAPTLDRVRMSSNATNRTDQLTLRAMIELSGSVALTDFREQTPGEQMNVTSDQVTIPVPVATNPIAMSSGQTSANASKGVPNVPTAQQPNGQPINVSPPVMGKTIHLQHVRLRFQIIITLLPLTSTPPFFVSVKVTAIEMPALLDHSIRTQLLKLLPDESQAQEFLHHLIGNICDPFVMPNCLHVNFNRSRYLKQIQNQLLNLLLKFDQRKKLLELLRKRSKKDENYMQKLNKNETMLLSWYKEKVLHKLKKRDLELSQRIHSPVPRFICCVKIIEFMNLAQFNRPQDNRFVGEQFNLLTCCLRIGASRPQLTSPLPFNNSEILINETIWAPAEDFGDQIHLSLLLSARPLNVKSSIDTRLTNDRSLKELAKVRFCVQKLHFGSILRDETQEQTTKKKQISDVEFYARNGIFDSTYGEQFKPHQSCVNGQDLWLPLDQCQGGLVHLQVGLFALEASMKALLDSNQINAALSANLFIRQRRFPVGLLSVYVRQLQITNPREKRTDHQAKADESQNWFVSVNFRGLQQCTGLAQSSRNHFHWLQTLHFVLDKVPFDSELVFRLQESSSSSSSSATAATLSPSNNNQRNPGNNETTNRHSRHQRHAIALLQLNRLKQNVDKDLSFCEQVTMYVGNHNENRMLQQMRTHERLLSQTKPTSDQLKQPNQINPANANAIDQLNKDDQDIALRDCIQLGLLSVHVAVRFINLQTNVLQKLQETCCIKAPQKTSTSDNKCVGCRNLFTEPIVTQRARDDVKDTELMKLIRQRVDAIQMIQDNSVCQVKIKFRLHSSLQLEATVERAVHVPQVDVLSKMQVQTIIELWKGKIKLATARSMIVTQNLSPVFDFNVCFKLDGGNVSQYVLRVALVQRKGFLRHRHHLIAEGFCSLPLLDMNESVAFRWYQLTNVSTAMLNVDEEMRPHSEDKKD